MSRHKIHKPKRVFIGIKLAEELEGEFLHLESALAGLPLRFIPPEDIHLTLVPPFQTRDLPFTSSELHQVLSNIHQFKLRTVRLAWGPKKEQPRLVWVEWEASKELIELKKKLLRTFRADNVKEKVPFIPHTTIARLQRYKKGAAVHSSRNNIERPVRLSMNVVTVELFESPHRGGVGYTVLTSVPLQPKDGTPIWHGS